MKKCIGKVLILFFLSNCQYYDQKMEIGSKTTVNPTVVNEKANVDFYVSDQLNAKLSKIKFSSSKYLKGNPDCYNLMRLKISGSIDYFQLLKTLKKRTHDMGGNAIGVYNYKEFRRVYINQIEIKSNGKLNPETETVLIKENKNIAKITADIFRCENQLS